jgi:hypothetical protein
MSTQEAVGEFFAGLSSALTQQTIERERQVDHFFKNLQRQLAKFHDSKRHLDRYLATDFNIFGYIEPDENRLSNMIRDLLDPNGPHGQESLFLEEFLKLLGTSTSFYSAERIRRVIREDPTTYVQASQRRRDITIDFGDAGIGIENKPWAGEQKDQLEDYQAHLSRRYQSNFVLVYLSGNGSEPQSLTPQTKETLYREGKLGVFAYRPHVQGWLEACYRECHSEKVRWFLRDFVEYVIQGFPMSY